MIDTNANRRPVAHPARTAVIVVGWRPRWNLRDRCKHELASEVVGIW